MNAELVRHGTTEAIFRNVNERIAESAQRFDADEAEFVCDGRAVVALVPGDRRADGVKIARAVGASSARVAGREEVLAATGFPPGAVAPFPLPDVEHVLLERTLLAEDQLWVGAGSERHLARLPAAELLRLSRARPMDAVEDHTYHSS